MCGRWRRVALMVLAVGEAVDEKGKKEVVEAEGENRFK